MKLTVIITLLLPKSVCSVSGMFYIIFLFNNNKNKYRQFFTFPILALGYACTGISKRVVGEVGKSKKNFPWVGGMDILWNQNITIG